MFSKSKRFDDKPAGCGADAAYDPKNQAKPIGGVIPTVDRFVELKSPSSVKSDTESVHSEKSAQVFRTPKAVKAVRRFPITPSLRTAVDNGSGIRVRSQSSDSFMKELLEAKCVELRHKDATIADYESQIKQMKGQLSRLEDDVVHFRQLTLIPESTRISATNDNSLSLNACDCVNRSATQEISKLNECIRILTDDNESLRRRIESVENAGDIERLQRQSVDLNREREAFKLMLAEFGAEIDKENRNEEITNRNLPDVLLAFIDAYRFEVNTAAAFQSALSVSEKEIADLKRVIIERDEQSSGENELKDKIAELESRVAELNDYDEKRSMDVLGMSNVINAKDALCDSLLDQLTGSGNQISELKENLALVKGHHSLALEANESIRHEYKMETDALKTKHEEELASLDERYKNQAEMTREQYFKEFDKCQTECSDRIKLIEDDFNAQFQRLEENWLEKLRISEIQFEERYQDLQSYAESRIAQEKQIWQSSLQECQKIAENEIISSELRIIELNGLLEISKKKNDALNENVKAAKGEMEELKTKLQSVQEENIKYSTNIANLKGDVERINIEKTRFTVTLETTRQTVEVLGSRLRNSDEDVEKLKSALEENMQAKLTAENNLKRAEEDVQKVQSEYNQVLVEIIKSKAALDQSHIDILDKNADLLRTATQMESEFTAEIHNLNSTLLDDIDKFKRRCARRVAELADKLSQEQKLCKEMKSQCDEAYRMIRDCQNALLQAEGQLETKDQELNELSTENDKLTGTLAAVEQEKNELQLLLNEFRNLVCDKDRRLHVLASQLDDKDREAFDFENRIKKMSQFLEATEYIIIEKDTEIAKLKNALDEFNGNERDVSLLHEEINKYIEQNQLMEFEKNQVVENYNRLQFNFDKIAEDEKQSKDIIKAKEKNILEYIEKNTILENDIFNAELHMKSCREDLLELQCSNLEKDLQEITVKYTNLLSHQNNKQKIKHVIDLKTLNSNLKEENEKLTHTVHKQTATIEKMRKEFAESNKIKSPVSMRKSAFRLSTSAGKENIASPLGKSPKTTARSPAPDAERSLTPLRESNR